MHGKVTKTYAYGNHAYIDGLVQDCSISIASTTYKIIEYKKHRGTCNTCNEWRQYYSLYICVVWGTLSSIVQCYFGVKRYSCRHMKSDMILFDFDCTYSDIHVVLYDNYLYKRCFIELSKLTNTTSWTSWMVYDRDHFVYAPSQWETTLQCNVVSHWLGAYTKWSLQNKEMYNRCKPW